MTQNNRQIAGQINFNVNFLSINAQKLALTKNYMVHILGFSESLYLYLINPITGNLVIEEELSIIKNNILDNMGVCLSYQMKFLP